MDTGPGSALNLHAEPGRLSPGLIEIVAMLTEAGQNFPLRVEQLPDGRAGVDVHEHSPRLAYFVGEIARYVTAMDLDFVALSDKRTGSQKPHKALESLVAQNPNSCWILFGSNAPTQKWFADKGIPAVLLGSCFTPGILHSIDQDMRATCRYAAGRLLALGHTRINEESLAHKLAQLAVSLLEKAKSKTSTQLVEPDFHKGESIAPLKKLEHMD